MRQEELVGKAQTVLGIINADDLGITLPHEHLLTDLSSYFTEPTEAGDKSRAYEQMSMENRSWLLVNRSHNFYDNKLTDEDLAIKEVLHYKNAGGNTIVEMSNNGLSRDPLGLARISRATDLNVIMGAGYYLEVSHPPELATRAEEEITEEIVRDILVGVSDTGVRSGIIGEIGCSVPLAETERKVLRASAAAQRRTGAGINIHPSFRNDLVLEIIKILGDAGADLSRTVISHCDVGRFKPIFHKIADAGCFIEFDTTGEPAVVVPDYLCPDDTILAFPSDLERINEIKQLIDEGYLNQILISQDTCMRHSYITYGGHGYAHILNNVVPWMRRVGISNEQIQTMIVENPKRLLTFTRAKE